MKQLSGLLLICISLILVGCAPRQPAIMLPNNQVTTWPLRQQALMRINNWQINGAVAIRTPQKALSASINWLQQGACCYQLHLFGPLDIGAISLIGSSYEIILKESNGKIYTASNPEQLLQTQLGWQLPLTNLYYWVRGLPAPGISATTTFDKFNHLSSLQQQGWQINYLSYTSVGKNDLPSKIFMQNGAISVRLIISQWQL
ncbi:MAG: outer membrane lipoprotein LolB [Gammaproteobacteria bacterium RIFCSPHIGHO2_12_FULL_35_23]|nr:MAG: outer membrane lipoprotein LolB [Gammaproteobacteria bacterium RIFCSPHIGHO2_12_FULL_35_23]